MVLTRTVGSRQLVIAASEGAKQLGIRRGLTLAQARALCADVKYAEHEPHRDQLAIEALARWAMRFTPIVAIHQPDADDGATPSTRAPSDGGNRHPRHAGARVAQFCQGERVHFAAATAARSPTAPDAFGLYLDLTGCDLAFGGLENLVAQITAAFARLGIGCVLCTAPTPGAAWALTFETTNHGGVFGMPIADCRLPIAKTSRPLSPREKAGVRESVSGVPSRADRVANRQSAIGIRQSVKPIEHSLTPLPPIALRLAPATAMALHHVGVETIGQLLKLPRDQLPARFGPHLLLRIDQALGHIPEPLVPVDVPQPIEHRVDFETPVDALEPVWHAAVELVGKLCADLTRRGRGVRVLTVELLRPRKQPSIRQDLRFARATRDPKAVFRLIRCAIEAQQQIRQVMAVGKQLKRDKRKRRRGLPIAHCRLPIGQTPRDDTSGPLSPRERAGVRGAHPPEDRATDARPLSLGERVGVRGAHSITAARDTEHPNATAPSRAVARDEVASLHDDCEGHGAPASRAPDGGPSVAPLHTSSHTTDAREDSAPPRANSRPLTDSPRARADSPPQTSTHPNIQTSAPIQTSSLDYIDEGFSGLRVAVVTSDLIVDRQIDFAGNAESELADELARLIERLRARMGMHSVVRPVLVERYVPEKAWREALPDDEGLPDRDVEIPRSLRSAPVELLPTPEEVQVVVSPSHDLDGRPVAITRNGHVHRIRTAAGPDRIGGLWWQSHFRTRDYFDVEDDAGERLWVFRVLETGKWFVHSTE